MAKITEVVLSGTVKYKKEDLMKLNPVLLRALLRERVHHNIEVPLYTILLRWENKPMTTFGLQAQLVFDVWRERGLPEDGPDIEWAKRYLRLAEQVRNGIKPEIDEPLPEPFTEEEIKVVEKLIWGRKSIRNWLDKPVPDWMIEKLLEAGRVAPIGCNLDEVYFIVLKDPEEKKMIWSDISTENAVIIVICYDTRIHKVVGQDPSVRHNMFYDAAAAADHICLMAHALGLGACWLSKTIKSADTEDTGEKFKKLYGLPDYIEPAMHIAVGWPAIGTIKTQRMPLQDLTLTREKPYPWSSFQQ